MKLSGNAFGLGSLQMLSRGFTFFLLQCTCDKICSYCTIILKAKTIKSPLFNLVSSGWEWKSCQCQKFFILICSLNSNNLFSVKQNNMLCYVNIQDRCIFVPKFSDGMQHVHTTYLFFTFSKLQYKLIFILQLAVSG